MYMSLSVCVSQLVSHSICVSMSVCMSLCVSVCVSQCVFVSVSVCVSSSQECVSLFVSDRPVLEQIQEGHPSCLIRVRSLMRSCLLFLSLC